jgi:hypothetical protein
MLGGLKERKVWRIGASLTLVLSRWERGRRWPLSYSKLLVVSHAAGGDRRRIDLQ